eukprot:3511651-Pyramimonas_sp.AAC.1
MHSVDSVNDAISCLSSAHGVGPPSRSAKPTSCQRSTLNRSGKQFREVGPQPADLSSGAGALGELCAACG